ncbi:ubiquinol-cytochrome c reductase iron-sulfur subunit [Arthrobacter sp. SO3]|uniref:QcrA and Rieske domain-containing protein n=1 Tax=Arthrobacter sp. SO3 TaxID=1897057 RepID=UPI001CFFCB32|nr:Rieske (2Fe-2S) protein [Arthrobacter sp. SO3]MCB5292149.1 Cytochrome b6-f complex iron-sulfur subunit [Arthrobacter sp. SO3]
MNPEKSLPRRSLLLGAGAVGGSALALSACAASTTETPASTASAAPSAPAGTAVRVGKLGDVEVGGTVTGKIEGKTVVIFRKDEKTVLAYDATCTHAGCPVAPAGEDFECPCHGSSFKGSDGSVVNGPARSPLAKLNAAIDGEWITVSA